jgi:LysM repeat protein
VVLAWIILPVFWVTAVLATPTHPASASTRTAAISTTSSTDVILTSSLTSSGIAAATVASPAPRHAAHLALRYTVQAGDTLIAIATRLGVHGGWHALYAANRHTIGPNPGLIDPGTVLRLPHLRVPTRYQVAAGDTLSGIAARFAIRGGWLALYTANWNVIGPNPGLIHPGTVLRLPHPARVGPPNPARHPHPAPTPPPPGSVPHHTQPIPTASPAATGMPRWLKIILVSVGLLILAALATEPLLRTARRRRSQHSDAAGPPIAAGPACEARPPGGSGPSVTAGPSVVALPSGPDRQPAAAGGPPPARASQAGIVLVDHDRLVVTRQTDDETIYVLRPPGEDPRAILRVARLILPEEPYDELARQLGVPPIRQVI